jgi:hypothetical protein
VRVEGREGHDAEDGEVVLDGGTDWVREIFRRVRKRVIDPEDGDDVWRASCRPEMDGE